MKDIKKILINSLNQIIKTNSAQEKLEKIKKKHLSKPHFIPIKYRIFNGLLQSMNIKFGNFLETAISDILTMNQDNEILPLSGHRQHNFTLSKEADRHIDDYITLAQSENNTEEKINENYDALLDKLLKCNNNNAEQIVVKHDVDLLFKNRKLNKIFYVEIKYNDDHDTGKFISINSKLLKTYSYLTKELQISDKSMLQPILYYFNKKIMKRNIYLPEGQVVYRGAKLFDEFATIKYVDFEKMLQKFAESKEVAKQFNNLYGTVMK